MPTVGPDPKREFRVTVPPRQAAKQVRFREAGLDLLRRGIERAGLETRDFPWPPPGDPAHSAYRALKPLEAEDAAVFFGRDVWIVHGIGRVRGLTKLGTAQMLVILDASGSGKS